MNKEHWEKLTGDDACVRSEALGFRPFPMIQANLGNSWGRRKRWSYFSFCNGRQLLAFALADLDYTGHIFITLYDYEEKSFVQREETIPLAKGIELPEHPTLPFHYESRDFRLHMTAEDQSLAFTIFCRDFGGHKLEAQFSLDLPSDQESMNVVVPWSSELYHYTAKFCALPVEGQLTWKEGIAFPKTRSLACHDFARGIWPWKSQWNWCSAFGFAEGERQGLNLGAGWTDGTGAWENAVYRGRRALPIALDLSFVPADQSFQHWTIQSKVNADVDLLFEADYVRRASNRVAFFHSDLVQCFGTVRGTVRSGELLFSIPPMPAIVEDHNAVW